MANGNDRPSGEATYGQELALKVAKDRLKVLLESNEILDRRAVQLTTLSSAVGALAGAAKILPGNLSWDVPSLLVLGVLVCSARVMGLTVAQLGTEERKYPGTAASLDYHNDFIANTPIDAVRELTSQVCICIETEEIVNCKKGDSIDSMLFWLQRQIWLLLAVVAWPWIGELVSTMFHDLLPHPLPC